MGLVLVARYFSVFTFTEVTKKKKVRSTKDSCLLRNNKKTIELTGQNV